MNLLLLRPWEILDEDRAFIVGPRRRHLVEVLGCRPGRLLRAGLPDGPSGEAEVLRADAEGVLLACRFSEPPRPPIPTDLVLALPRPKVLRRVLEHVAALGVRRLLLTRACHVDRSYFGTALLEPETMREHLLLGLEQACDTRVPQVAVFDRFRPFVEDRLDDLLGPGRRFVLHPEAPGGLADEPIGGAEPVALALGPERGWVAFELELLEAQGFRRATLGDRVLRLETACTAALAQVALLRSLGTP